jgi:hypothetical protein
MKLLKKTLNENSLSAKYFKDLSFLFVVTLIVYWPLSTNYLSLKNDALAQFLAFRYHLSEAVQHGYLPFWSPYLYTGFPIHADIQGEVWNPFVLLLSLISKYDMTILQWEVLIYLYLSAVGMYRLIKYLGLSRASAICCGVAFMSCGYMTDSVSIIPWIASAAFIPFVIMYFLRSLHSLLLSDAVKFSLAVSMLFLCGYPSFFIYLNYIIGASLALWIIYQIKNGNKRSVLKTLLHLSFACLFFLLLCSPAIVSYYELLPYYPRGSGLDYHAPGENSFLPYSLITYLLPNVASKANFLNTDLSMRNTYIGIFLFFFFLSSLKNLDRFKIAILIFTIFSFLFSLGDLTPVQKISYDVLPMIKMFRHPGTIRLFTSIGMILLAGYAIDAFFRREKTREIQWMIYIGLLLLTLAGIYFITTEPWQTHMSGFSLNPAALKEFLYNISFQKFALVICILQFIFFLCFLLLLQRKNNSQKAIITLFLLNSILFAWVALPFTVLSQYRTNEVDNYIRSFPGKYLKPDLAAPIESDVYSDSTFISPHGYHNFYNKKITIQDHIITPTLNTDYGRFLRSKALRMQLKDHPFAYVSNDSVTIQPATISILKFTPNAFKFQVNTYAAGKFQLFQQFNPNWNARVNNKSTQISKSNIAFMSVPIPPGTSIIEWKYSPKKVFAAMILSALSLLTIVFYFVFERKRQKIYA